MKTNEVLDAINFINKRDVFSDIILVFDILYDTRCYYKVRAKADIRQLNLPQ